MGLFGIGGQKGPQKRKRGQRGPSKSAEERERLYKLRWLRDLKKGNPDVHDEIMREEFFPSKKPQKSEIQQVLETLKALRGAGLIEDPRDAGKDNLWADVSKMLPGVLAGIAQMQQAAIQNAQRQMVAEAPVAALPAQTQTLPEENAEVSPASMFLIAQFQSKNPRQAAEWLMSEPRTAELVAAIRSTPEPQLPQLIAGLATSNPQLAGAVRWLQTHWDWTAQVATFIKGASSNGHRSADLL